MIEKNIKYIMRESIASATVFYLTNPFFLMFAKRMGANNYELSMINALPALVAFFVLVPGALILDEHYNKKKVIVRLIAVQAILLPMIGISPFLKQGGVWIFIISIALMNGPIAIYNIGWQSLFSDLFYDDVRIKTYSKRTSMYTLVGMVITILAGFIMTTIPNSEEQRLLIYQSFYLIAFLFCCYQCMALNKLEAKTETKRKVVIKSISMQALKEICNKKFISFIMMALCVNSAWYFGHSLFFVYHANCLGSDEMWISLMTVGSSIACVGTYKFWSDFMLKNGSEKTLMLGVLGLALNPLVVLAENMLIYVMLATLFSLSFPAFQLGIFESVLKIVDNRHKTLAIALYTSIISIGAFCAPIAGIWLSNITNIKIAMYTCIFLRSIAAVYCYIEIKNKKYH